MLFGTDVSKIPCYRQTFLMGISGGIGVGLINFLLTSKDWQSSSFIILADSFQIEICVCQSMIFLSDPVLSSFVGYFSGNPRKSSNRGVAGFGVITSLTWYVEDGLL